MPLNYTKQSYQIPAYLRGIMEYYPDVFLFKLNQEQYTKLWRQLSSARYLYTNGYSVKPTNWFVYAIQSFWGWLGFTNHCQAEKVTYTLNKLAYYGYAKKFIQPDFSAENNELLSPQVKCLVVKKYNNETTQQLQLQLVKEFLTIQPHFHRDYSYEYLNADHPFGESWRKVELPEWVPELDPQDPHLIQEVIHLLEQKSLSASEISFLENSQYAVTAAQYYYEKAKNTAEPSFLSRLIWTDPRPRYLEEALMYYPDIAMQDPQLFIQHLIKKERYQFALQLMELVKDSRAVLQFLLSIPLEVRQSLIQKDSSLAISLAQHHLERKEYVIAQQWCSNIELINPNAAFHLAIEEKNYLNAYKIFQKHEAEVVFSMPARIALAQIFCAKGEQEYEAGRVDRANKEWTSAEQHYLRSGLQKKAAYHLHPSENYRQEVQTHQRLYAQILIDADVDLHQPEASNEANISKAINLLNQCDFIAEDEQLMKQTALANALMRRVDTLRQYICFDYTPHDRREIRQHPLKHPQQFAALIKALEDVIALLKDTKDKDLRLKLGKAHYLLADIHDFFDINHPDINYHYKRAWEIVPENPFYRIRVSELFEYEKKACQEQGIIGIKSLGYTTFDYNHWSDERWVKRDQIIFNIKDIHMTGLPPVEQKRWSLGV